LPCCGAVFSKLRINVCVLAEGTRTKQQGPVSCDVMAIEVDFERRMTPLQN